MEAPAVKERLLAAAFKELLDGGLPLSLDDLAVVLGASRLEIDQAASALTEEGRLRWAPDGLIVGAAGLSVRPSRHRMLIGERLFWTWCAYDAVGILGALRADGRVASRSPLTGQALEISFRAGEPEDLEPVIYMAERDGCRSSHDEWCPKVNLFESRQAAEDWAARESVPGAPVGILEAARKGADWWGRLLATAP